MDLIPDDYPGLVAYFDGLLQVCVLYLPSILRPQERLRSIVMSMSVCLPVCEHISGTSRVNFFCTLPMSVARSSVGMLTIGRIAYRREGVFFPIENALSAGKGG